MAEMTQKLKFLTNGGQQYSCNIYTDPSDTNNEYICVSVGGTKGYVAIGDTSHSCATPLHISSDKVVLSSPKKKLGFTAITSFVPYSDQWDSTGETTIHVYGYKTQASSTDGLYTFLIEETNHGSTLKFKRKPSDVPYPNSLTLKIGNDTRKATKVDESGKWGFEVIYYTFSAVHKLPREDSDVKTFPTINTTLTVTEV